MDRRANLPDLRLNDLFLRVGQGKDLDGHLELFQRQDFVQDKGL